MGKEHIMHITVQLYRLTCVCVDMMVLISRYWRAASHYLFPLWECQNPSSLCICVAVSMCTY
jgi:hypothetical protein